MYVCIYEKPCSFDIFWLLYFNLYRQYMQNLLKFKYNLWKISPLKYFKFPLTGFVNLNSTCKTLERPMSTKSQKTVQYWNKSTFRLNKQVRLGRKCDWQGGFNLFGLKKTLRWPFVHRGPYIKKRLAFDIKIYMNSRGMVLCRI